MPTIQSEITEARTREAKHFLTDVPGSFMARISCGALHFRDASGEWQDMTNLVGTDAGGRKVTQTKDFTVGINPTAGDFFLNWKGQDFAASYVAVWLYDPSTNRRQRVQTRQATVWVQDGLDFSCSNLFTNTTLRVGLYDTGTRKELTVSANPNFPDPIGFNMNPATTLVVYEISAPGIKNLLKVLSTGQSISGVMDGDLYFDIPNGPRVNLPAGPVRTLLGASRLNVQWVSTTQIPFGIAVPYPVYQESTYPLSIDPSTTIEIGGDTNDGEIIKIIDLSSYQVNVTSINFDRAGYSSDEDHEYVYRAYHRFDTTSLSGKQCDAATVRFTSPTTQSMLQGRTQDVYVLTSDWVTLDSGDWDAAGTLAGQILTDNIPYNIAVNQTWDVALNAGLVGAKFGGYVPLQSKMSDETSVLLFIADYGFGATKSADLLLTYSDVQNIIGPFPTSRRDKL